MLATAALTTAAGWASQAAAESASRAPTFTAEQRAYWVLQPVKRTVPPVAALPAAGSQRAAGPIDAYIASRLHNAGLKMAPEADRRTLIRRLAFDLHGLPPSPQEVEEFMQDASPDAYERLVDRLLASPRLGERWARHWLDLVRYAETDGFKADVARPNAWRYRDYVIAVFNHDRPYDRFLAEQLAGDELAPDDPQALVATGFLRHWPYEDNGRDVMAQRANILADVTDVVGQAFLGLTFKCARCHDHKYDPILQRDYYRLQAFFAPMVDRDDAPVVSAERRRDLERQRTAWEAATAELRRQIDAVEAPIRDKMRRDAMQVLPKEVQAILLKSPADRTPQEHIIADLASKQLQIDAKAMAGRMKKEQRAQWDQLQQQLGKMSPQPPPPGPVAMAVRDHAAGPPPTRIPGHDAAGDIEPGFPSILDPQPATIQPVSFSPNGAVRSTGRRAALAKWIASPKNPLTARVIVNRLWQHHFGAGLVATSGDFGAQGERPTHPELLDHLAADLVQQDWRLKSLHRALVTSATYRQVSNVPPQASSLAPQAADHPDPDNKLLWRMPLRRIESEVVRDAMLAVSGELSLKHGGPSVLPELPKELSARYGWKPTPGAAEQNRRSVYLFVKRNLRLPLFDAFDTPDTHECCTRRDVTTTAPQALLLLNDRWSLDRAQALAKRVVGELGHSLDPIAQVRAVYSLALARQPTSEEESLAARFLQSQPTPPPSTSSQSPPATLIDFCHALLNANEFVYVD